MTDKFWKQAVIIMIGLMPAAFPPQVLAATPEFARSTEEWASLEDDRIEYDELESLIHEYNATVKKNQIDLNEFRKEYGESNDEWADRYRELADDLENSLDYPDVDDSSYASAMTNIVTSEMQIEAWREKADDALEDYLVYYYDYSAAEKALVVSAQNHMIQYYLNQLQIQAYQANLDLMQEKCRNVMHLRDIGMSTDVEVLSARENLRMAERAIQDTQSAAQTEAERLYVMLGWKHDARPVIGEIPPVNMDRIATMNPAEEKAAALENNYALKANKRRLENARASDQIESLQETVMENEQNIGAALNAAYQEVISARAAYFLSQAQAELAQKNMGTAERQHNLGSISGLDYLTKRNETETARVNAEMARIKLFQAVQSYEWAVNGLASVS